MVSRRLVALVAWVVLAAGATADTVDSIVREAMKEDGIPGLSLEIVRCGSVVKRQGYGKANLETPSPVTAKTKFEIGSMTKQFTAAAVLMLVDRHKLSLGDPIGKYLDNLPDAWKPLTVRQILSHTAGLKDYLGSFNIGDPNYVSTTKLIDRVGSLPLDFPPGSSWSYSNTGYLLAGLLVEEISGQKLPDFWRRNIFVPLGMFDTGPTQPDDVIPDRARGYAFTGRGYKNEAPGNMSLLTGAGLLMSTANDLGKWAVALDANRLLSPDSYKAFCSSVDLSNGKPAGYGLGWFIQQDRDVPIVEHGGNTAGFSGNIYRLPSRGTTIVILTNLYGVDPSMIARRLCANLYPDMDLSKRCRETDPCPADTQAFVSGARDMAKGHFSTQFFAPELVAELNTLRGVGLRQGFAAIGRYGKTFDYIDQDIVGGERHARYAIPFPGATLYMEVRFTSDHRIGAITTLYQEPNAKPKREHPSPSPRPRTRSHTSRDSRSA